jgi:hypothetical protein
MSKTPAQNEARASRDGKRGKRICLNTAFQCASQLWRFLLVVGL